MDCHGHVCSIIPAGLIQQILDKGQVSEPTRAALQKTYNQVTRLQADRRNHHQQQQQQHQQQHQQHQQHGQGTAGQSSPSIPPHPPRRGIIPPQIFQAMRESEETSPTQKEHAEKNLDTVQRMHAMRADAQTATSAAGITTTQTAKTVFREIYTSEKTDIYHKTLLFQEGDATTKMTDTDGKNVYQYFGDTFKFYMEVFNRNSVDNNGLHMKGSVHYDDQPGPPGMDNAYWNGQEMAFGDGDGQIFGSFTKNIDVIGHELTHGVTQYTAQLAYEFQSGALNESISDVFGSMVKQYTGGPGGAKQKATDADWLIGAGIFLPTLANAKALRSMKAPGTAYDNPMIGKDQQPSTMDGYIVLPNTIAGDHGGVHYNSGIPNYAFYLMATSLGGYSWDKAGPIWYAAMNDAKLRGIGTKTAFKVFADLTVNYALSMYDSATQAKVRQAWVTVKVL